MQTEKTKDERHKPTQETGINSVLPKGKAVLVHVTQTNTIQTPIQLPCNI